jgi:hypothetical protein
VIHRSALPDLIGDQMIAFIEKQHHRSVRSGTIRGWI